MRSIPYITAFLVGLFARTLAAYSIGLTDYRMNGIDWLCGLVCIVMVWSFKGAFLSPKKKSRR